jgi:hypothetical protein
MRFKFYDLFIYLTGVLLFISFFQGYVFFFAAVYTGSTALIYDAFNKKGLQINRFYVLGHFILTIASIYISYFSLKLFLTILVQIIQGQGIDEQALQSLFLPMVVDAVIFILSLTLFIRGLHKAKWTNQTTTNSA